MIKLVKFVNISDRVGKKSNRFDLYSNTGTVLEVYADNALGKDQWLWCLSRFNSVALIGKEAAAAAQAARVTAISATRPVGKTIAAFMPMTLVAEKKAVDGAVILGSSSGEETRMRVTLSRIVRVALYPTMYIPQTDSESGNFVEAMVYETAPVLLQQVRNMCSAPNQFQFFRAPPLPHRRNHSPTPPLEES